MKRGTGSGAPLFLAAAAAIVVAAAVVVVTAAHAVVAAATEQQDQDDDPPAVITTETIVAHKKYLRVFLSGDAAHSNLFRRLDLVHKGKDQLICNQLVFALNSTGRRGICLRRP